MLMLSTTLSLISLMLSITLKSQNIKIGTLNNYHQLLLFFYHTGCQDNLSLLIVKIKAQ